MGTHYHDQPPEHWAGPESLDPTPVWKQYLVVAGLLVLALVLIAALAVTALMPQWVTPPAVVPGGRVVLALDEMPGVGAAPLLFAAPLVDEAHAFWVSQPLQGELVAVRARWSPSEDAGACEVVALVPALIVLGAVWGATGAGGAVLVGAAASSVAWTVLAVRLRREWRNRPAPKTGPS